jgi:hypothetical protein
VGDIEPVARFGEPKVGVHTGDHDPDIHREDLNPHQCDTGVQVDDQPFLEDQIDHIGQAAGAAAGTGGSAGVLLGDRRSHSIHSLDVSLMPEPPLTATDPLKRGRSPGRREDKEKPAYLCRPR